MARFHRIAILGALALGAPLTVAAADVPINAVPPAQYVPRAQAKQAQPALSLAVDAPATRITLAPPSATERASLKAMNVAPAAVAGKAVASGGKGQPLMVAYGRIVPSGQQSIALNALQWQAQADGSRVAHVVVQSPTAAALRVAVTMSAPVPGLTLTFAGAAGAQVFAPVTAAAVVDAARDGTYWSPVLEGDTATVELRAAADAVLGAAVLNLARVSHQTIAPAALKAAAVKLVSDIGTSGACEIDVKCVTNQSAAFVNSTRAVAEYLFTVEDGRSGLCTGQLLNDSVQSFTPYFLSANHCVSTAASARSLNTFWFFEANSCGSLAVPPYIQQTGGAALLARSQDWDWSLMRLNEAPPAGTYFQAWRADAVSIGADISVVHHPEGDLKKWAGGQLVNVNTYTDGSRFWVARYSQGSTEPGSSGAGLLTYNATGGYYEVRGGLWRGSASCDNPTGTDEYSQLGNMLSKVREYLTPDSNPVGTTAAVEFYNRSLNHYFISANPAEIDDLDAGRHAGWERTGLRFNAYATGAVAGTSPVCRFYRAPAYGDSHFYSASPAECAATAAAHPVDWIYESPSVFYIFLPNPTTGACPLSTQPVWRFFNQVTTNHRYTADVGTRSVMQNDPGNWIAEGYGPEAVIMCSPVGA